MLTYRARFSGAVQGIGFRPYLHRLATRLGVHGYAANTKQGVLLVAQGRNARELLRSAEREPPPLSRIVSLKVDVVRAERLRGFSIVRSRGRVGAGVEVLPDLAMCRDCRRELLNPTDRRYAYPFINCTQCGPRYSIVEALPYDRPRTTMSRFRMCALCRREYDDLTDRRFHAEPTACPNCGPALTLLAHAHPEAKETDGPSLPALSAEEDPFERAAAALLQGKIVALKSLGGFQFACDAANHRAVLRLRRMKERPAKPLALMCERVSVVRRFCCVSPAARSALESPAAPIVLLPRRERPRIALSDSIAPGNGRLGVMLCYTPLHALLFRALRRLAGSSLALVVTSANVREEPIAATERELGVVCGELLAGSSADLILTHNRPIANRCDDSVVLVTGPADRQTATLEPPSASDVEVQGADGRSQNDPKSEPRTGVLSHRARVGNIDGHRRLVSPPGNPAPTLSFVRRARGYAPQPISLAPWFHVKHPVLAVGAEYKNVFALAHGERVVLSPHIGAVATERGQRFWMDTLARIASWTGIRPAVVVCDLHPNYASTRLAEGLAHEHGAPLLRVQHHYAHILSVVAEHGLDERALGLAFDGTGYGGDGALWGGEFLLIDQDLSWSRVGHLSYLRLAAAGSEVVSPRRVASSYLRQAQVLAARTEAPRFAHPPQQPGDAVDRHRPRTSSMGRLFDAVAAITGVCPTASFDGQAAIALESAADKGERGHWFGRELLDTSGCPFRIRVEPLLLEVSRETARGASPATVSAKFHNTLVRACAHLTLSLCDEHALKTVCLSGGSFQNLLLKERLSARLHAAGLRVLANRLVPCNDGGVALGQVLVGSRTARPVKPV